MGAILRAYESAKALGELDSVPFALAGSHWLTDPSGKLIVNDDGSPHTYWDCKYVLQTTLDSHKYARDGIRYVFDFFGGYDGVWVSRNEPDQSCRYYGFNVGEFPHDPFFNYDYRGRAFSYDDVVANPKRYRQQFAFKNISVWECFDARMLLNLINGNWNKFLGKWYDKTEKPTKSKIRMAKAIKSRLIKTLLHHEVIERNESGKYDIHWKSQTDFAEFENVADLHHHGKIRTTPTGRESHSYAFVGNLKQVYPMKRRPTLEQLRGLLGMDECRSVQSLMRQNGFRDTLTN